jgi:hypothetical protein
MLMSVPAVYAAATLFAQSYNQTMEVYRQGATSQVYAATIASYDGPASSYVGFWGGYAATGLNDTGVLDMTKKSIDFLEKAGYGYNIWVRTIRVEPYSQEGAAVWLGWTLKPKNGADLVEWETLYGYRMNASVATPGKTPYAKCGVPQSLSCKVGGKDKVEGWWEFTVTDNEIAAFTKRIPNYLDSYSS